MHSSDRALLQRPYTNASVDGAYRVLRTVNPSPYMYYLTLPDERGGPLVTPRLWSGAEAAGVGPIRSLVAAIPRRTIAFLPPNSPRTRSEILVNVMLVDLAQ